MIEMGNAEYERIRSDSLKLPKYAQITQINNEVNRHSNYLSMRLMNLVELALLTSSVEYLHF